MNTYSVILYHDFRVDADSPTAALRGAREAARLTYGDLFARRALHTDPEIAGSEQWFVNEASDV